MAQERIILDPAELASGRVELDITPWVDVEGVDWGDAEIQAYKAEAQVGESVIDFRLPNRAITAPLVVREQGGTSFAKARSYIQAKAALGQREGLIGKRILATGGTVYFDIVANGLTLSGNSFQARASNQFDVDAELRLEAIPDFYEPEELIAEAEEKTATELIKVIPDPGGDMPARVRIVVEEKQGSDQKGLIWSFRSRYYSSATTAKTAYEAEELTAAPQATKVALSGASGGSAVAHTSLPVIWTPVVETTIGGTNHLTHQGTYRVLARAYSPDGTAVAARLVWDVGDLRNPTSNPEWRFPGGSAFYIADLGEVRLDPAPIGTHRWQGQIQAIGTKAGEDIQVDKVWIVNCDEGQGILSAPPNAAIAEAPLAWDNFNTYASGTITGQVAPMGGTWTGAGDAVGMTVFANSFVYRSEKSDADLNTGYYARIGTATAVGTDVRLDVLHPLPGEVSTTETSRAGLFMRYSSTSNWLLVAYEYRKVLSTLEYIVKVYKRVAGTVTPLSATAWAPAALSWRTLRASVSSAGIVAVYEGLQNSGLSRILTVRDSALASGGALESGGFGVYDVNTSATAALKGYDNFLVAGENLGDAILFASQKAQLTTNGMYRLDPGGTAYGPVSRVIGDLPRLPAGNLEGRSVELFLKASRGDMEQASDSAIDDLAVKVYGSRSWLTVPGTI